MKPHACFSAPSPWPRVIATSLPKTSEGFTRWWPSVATMFGWLVFKQTLDTPALLGMGLIVAGVLVIHLFSRSVAH